MPHLLLREIKFLSVVLLALLCSAVGQCASQAPDLSPAAVKAFTEAQQAQKAGNLPGAIEGYRRVLKLAPDFAGAHFNLGLSFDTEGKPTEALAEFTTAIKLQPTLDAALLFIGIENYRLFSYPEAITALQSAVRLRPRDKEAWLWLGKSQFQLGQIEPAAKALETARQLAPRDLNILYNLGEVYSQLSKQMYDQMYVVDPNSYLVHLVLAESFAAQKDREAAVREYREVLKQRPQMHGIHEAMGSLFMETLKNRDDAKREFAEELKVDPANSVSSYKTGILLVSEHQFADAVPFLERGLGKTPNVGQAQHYLGQALFHLNRFDEALAHLQKAAQLDPKDASVHFLLAQSLRKLNRPEEAATELALFERLGTEEKEATAARVTNKVAKQAVAANAQGHDADSSHE